MQRIGILLLFILLIMSLVSFYLAQLSSYVLLVFPHWNLQMPLWLAVLLLMSGFVMAYAFLALLRALFAINRRTQHWLSHKQKQRGQHALRQGILALLSEQFTEAETKLRVAARSRIEPLLTQLALVFTLHQQKQYQQRDDYLNLLQQENPAARIELTILQARLQLANNDHLSALEKLQALRHVEDRYPVILRVLAKLYYERQRFTALAELLPSLEKYPSIDRTTYGLYLGATTQAELQQANDKISLAITWRGAAELARQQYQVLQTYIQQLLKFNLAQEAENVVRRRIEKQASDELYLLYASIPAEPQQQILQLETWLKRTPSQAALLCAAGQLCLRCHLWGKARDYFSASLQQQPNAYVYAALAKLFAQLGDKDKVASCYKQGLALLINVD